LKRFIADRVAAWRAAAGIDKLLLTGKRGSLAVFVVPLIVLFFAFGFWWPYWRVGDLDMWMVYEAFIYNDGLRQEFFEHPGYLTILLLGLWFKLLHGAGLLSIHALSELPPVADLAASGLAWMRATQAARLLSLLIGLAFLLSFATLLRALVRDWRIAALATFLLAFSGGFMMESRIVRTELIAAGFAYSALLILLIANGRSASARPWLVGAAALLATLAILNKVQIVFLLGAIPPVVFAFADNETRQGSRANAALAIAAVAAAAIVVWLAWPIARAGLFEPDLVARRRLLFGTEFPIQQTLTAVWFVGWMAAYAVRYRVGAIEALASFAALVAGSAFGLLALDLRYDVQNAAAVMNSVETMFIYAAGSHPELLDGGSVTGGAAGKLLFEGIALVLARLTFVLSSSPRPTIFLEWVVIAASIYAWRRGDRKTALQVAVVIAATLAIDLVGTLRGLKLEYFIITDPLVIIAAAWLLVKRPELQYHRWVYPIGLALVIATVAVGLAEPVKHSFKRDMPLDFCTPHYPKTQRIERFSFCPAA